MSDGLTSSCQISYKTLMEPNDDKSLGKGAEDSDMP